jgi:geranylgeranyl diphosphate synthase type II
MVQSEPVAMQTLRAPRDLSESWREVRERYGAILVDRLELDGPLRAVASHALAGGKRLRPMLAELLGRALGAPHAAVMDVAVAIEYLHTGSVILDDMPCMDDAAERRGAPPAHALYSEAEAILAAVALVSRGYSVLLLAPVPGAAAMALLATRTVASTMAPGQARELAGSATPSAESVERIHEQKTAALFVLLGRLVAQCAGASEEATQRVVAFTATLGHAYQIIDDIEDRNEPGEARANIALARTVEEARGSARGRLAEARRIIASLDTAGELGSFIGWLEHRVTTVT